MNFQHSAFHKVVDTFIRQVLVSKFGVKEDCQFGSLPSARAMVIKLPHTGWLQTTDTCYIVLEASLCEGAGNQGISVLQVSFRQLLGLEQQKCALDTVFLPCVCLPLCKIISQTGVGPVSLPPFWLVTSWGLCARISTCAEAQRTWASVYLLEQHFKICLFEKQSGRERGRQTEWKWEIFWDQEPGTTFRSPKWVAKAQVPKTSSDAFPNLISRLLDLKQSSQDFSTHVWCSGVSLTHLTPYFKT